MRFVQTIAITTSDITPVRDLMERWHANEAGTAPGYLDHRLLADRDRPGRYVIVVDFASADGAAENNARAETAAWAEALSTLIEGEAEFVQYDELHTTH